jgi:hypothetical protein
MHNCRYGCICRFSKINRLAGTGSHIVVKSRIIRREFRVVRSVDKRIVVLRDEFSISPYTPNSRGSAYSYYQQKLFPFHSSYLILDFFLKDVYSVTQLSFQILCLYSVK